MADASNIFRQYSQSFVYVPKAKAVRPQAALSILHKAYRVLFASDVEKVHSSLTHLEICGIVVNVNGCTYVFIVYSLFPAKRNCPRFPQSRVFSSAVRNGNK